MLSGGKGAVVGPHQQPQQAHLLTADPSVSAAETNHSYTNIAGIVGIEQQQHSARVMPPDYPLYEVPYQDQQVPANYQYSTTHYQQVWLISKWFCFKRLLGGLVGPKYHIHSVHCTFQLQRYRDANVVVPFDYQRLFY